MVQRADPDFSVPVDNTLKLHIKRLAEVYRQLPEHQEKSYCCLMVDGARKSDRRICDPDRASEAIAARFHLFRMDVMMFSRSNQVIVRLSYRFAVNFEMENSMILFRTHMLRRRQLKM
jgi:hypothetical protein